MGLPRILKIVLGASIVSQLALFMNGMAAAWTLTDLTESPVAFAVLNVATTLPTFLLALLAGALADVASRRGIMLIGYVANTLIVGIYALLAWQDAHSVLSILVLTAALGVVGAITGPAWMAVIPSLVPREELGSAMSLSSGASNLVMAIGPALAGVLVALQGPLAVFVLNVALLVAGLFVLRIHKPTPRQGLPPEHLGSAVAMGLRYFRYDRPLRRVILKMMPYAFAAVALMALLPAVARFQLGAGPTQFGILAGAGGLGAIIAMLIGPRIRARVGPDGIVLGAMLAQAAVLAVVSQAARFEIAFAALVLGGVALLMWISSVMTVLQAVLPSWIRGRGVAVYLLALQGTFTVGALFWGGLAERLGVANTLLAAAALMGLSAPLLMFVRLGAYVDMDTRPVQFVEAPTATSVHERDGPILVTAEWVVQPEQRAAFMAAMRRVHRGLKRNGALRFHLVEDVERPGHILESFTVATWAEFQRIPERTTAADHDVENALRAAAGGVLAPMRAHRVLDVKMD